jgi:hypothetical protein
MPMSDAGKLDAEPIITNAQKHGKHLKHQQ